MSEKDIQRDIMNILCCHPNVAFCWVTTTGRMRSSAGKYYTLGYPGIADIIGMLRDGRMLALEVKDKGGKTTKDQDCFLESVNHWGGLGAVVRSAEEVLAILDK